MTAFDSLRTKRLVIERMQPSDAATLVAYRNDPQVAAHQDWPLPYTDDLAEQLVRFAPALGDPMVAGGQFAIRLRDGSMVGDVYVQRHAGSDHAVELGITVASAAQGQGFASEAIVAVVDELFADPTVHKLVAFVSTLNESSLRLFDRRGFRREGLLRSSHLDRDGVLDDEVLFGLTRSEWERPRHQFDVVAFDADDTLWRSEDGFFAAEHAFVDLISPYAEDGVDVKAALTAVERKNLGVFGYGVRAFGLSMVETATSLGAETGIPPAVIARLVEIVRTMLTEPVHVLTDVPSVLEDVSRDHRLILITKGDLLHQTTKLESSGLAHHFEKIDIVTEKDSPTYARIIDELGIPPTRFCMVGNSVRSDVLPVLALGASAVHVPYHLLWDLEQAPDDHGHTFAELQSLAELPAWLRGTAAGATVPDP